MSTTGATPLQLIPGLEEAVVAFEQGDFAAASQGAARLLQAHPSEYAVLRFAALMASAEKRYDEAGPLLDKALACAPSQREQAATWNAVGHLAKTTRNLTLAEEAYRRATLLYPANVNHTAEFAEVLAAQGKVDPAIDVLRSAMTRHPSSPEPCTALGNVLIKANRQRDSLVFFDMALKRDSNWAPAHFNASIALTMLGNIEAARSACETALKLDPTLPGYYQLATLGSLKDGDTRLPELEKRAEQASAPSEVRVDAGFALGRVYDDAGDPDRAFRFLREANRLKRETTAFDIEVEEQRLGRITAFFTRDFLERFAGAVDSELAPIFIVGMPRSGTTLTEQMLAAHAQVQGGGELTHLHEIALQVGETWGSRGAASPGSDEQVAADLRSLAEKYAQRTATLRGSHPRFTDKLPGNYLFIGLIHLAFPRASIIHCRRDPVDTCLSCYQRLFSSDLPYSYDLTELGQYYNLYRRMMRHWHQVLPAGRILDVDYEAMVADPEAGLRRVLSFCGLDYDPACLNFHDVKRTVTTASATQVRRPIYGSSVRRWEKYRAHLGELMAALETDAAG